MALYDAAKSLNEGFFTIVVIVLSIYLASLGSISSCYILVYAILFTNITTPMREIHSELDEASEYSIQVNDLYNILHEPLDTSFAEQQPTAKIETNAGAAAVSVTDLSFAYPGTDHVTTLDGISLAIKNGESVGVAGASGCGKTTFIHILLRLIHGYTGDVSLFGEALEAISREELADKVAYVPQKPFVFECTIRDNILYVCGRAVAEDDLA